MSTTAAVTSFQNDSSAGQLALLSIVIPTTGTTKTYQKLLLVVYSIVWCCASVGLFYLIKYLLKHRNDPEDHLYGAMATVGIVDFVIWALALTGVMMNIKALVGRKKAGPVI